MVWRVLIQRLVVFAATLLGAVAFVQVLLWAAPGDPIDMLPNSDELRPVLEAQWHLDEPVPARLLAYASNAVRGDLGTSLTYRPGMPVAEVIAKPALRSVEAQLCANETGKLTWDSSFGKIIDCASFMEYYGIQGKTHREAVQKRLEE